VRRDVPRLPALIIVTGRPGAGKTTLAHALARAVRCPAVSRDEIKEGLVRTIGAEAGPSADLQREATDVFFEVLALLLRRGISVVAEAAFQHAVWAPRLEPLRAMARVRLILCEASSEHVIARRRDRATGDPDRSSFHPERARRTGTEDYDAPRLEVPTLVVDTTDGYDPDLAAIVAFARAE
jgi:predicted kinase